MHKFTRRGFVGGAAMAPLLIGGAAEAQAVGAAAGRDPYSYVNPELVDALRQFPQNEGPLNAQNLAAWRAADANSPAVSQAPELQPQMVRIPARAGRPEVSVLIIDPKPGTKMRPATLYIHGGGYVVGSAGTNLRLAQDIALGTESPVVSVDYALAPETKFPLSREQNYAALAWLFENADTLGVDPARIAILGDSAGGGHAAMLALAARDRKEFAIAYQCLIYPMLDDRTGSTRQVPPTIGHFIWTAAANRFGWSSLLGMPAGSASPPPGSVPARVTDLNGLPPTFIGVGSIDLFFEEDLAYARRLAYSGVSTELFVVPGAYHGFDVLARDAGITVQFREVWQSALRRGLGL
jgi:acetyl esterase/lipase